MAEDSSIFWSDVDNKLESHQEFILTDKQRDDIQRTERKSYEENLPAIREILEDWGLRLRRRGFRTELHEKENELAFTYTKPGYYGPGGFRSDIHVTGLRVAGVLIPHQSRVFVIQNDPSENMRLGTGFNPDDFRSFLQKNLSDYLQPDNLILSRKDYELARTLAPPSSELAKLGHELTALQKDPGRQRAGLALERLLNRLFALEDLEPRPSFRVAGEQIDGSFVLDSETYLVEAKWLKEPMAEAELLVFSGEIAGKSAFTRGVFVAINGVSEGAERAITQGKQPNFFVIDGEDLMAILSGKLSLVDLLRERQRLLAEQGLVVLSCNKRNRPANPIFSLTGV